MNPLDLMPGWLKVAILVAVAAAALLLFKQWKESVRDEGRQQVRAEWAIEREAQKTAALREAESNAKETLRRLQLQQENQRAQDAELARARDDAARNRADADRVREQAAGAAREWSARLADSPSREDLAAAAAAINLLTDVRSRLDAAATELASHATAARAAGLKCERDYDALTPR